MAVLGINLRDVATKTTVSDGAPRGLDGMYSRLAAEVSLIGADDGKLSDWEKYQCREAEKYYVERRREKQAALRDRARNDRGSALAAAKRVARARRERAAQAQKEANYVLAHETETTRRAGLANDLGHVSETLQSFRRSLADGRARAEAARAAQVAQAHQVARGLVSRQRLPHLGGAAAAAGPRAFEPRADVVRRREVLERLARSGAARRIQGCHRAKRARRAKAERLAAFAAMRMLAKRRVHAHRAQRTQHRADAVKFLVRCRLRAAHAVLAAWRAHVALKLEMRDAWKRRRAAVHVEAAFVEGTKRQQAYKRAAARGLRASGCADVVGALSAFFDGGDGGGDWGALCAALDAALGARHTVSVTSLARRVSRELADLMGQRLRDRAPSLEAYRSLSRGDDRLTPVAFWRFLERVNARVRASQDELLSDGAAGAAAEMQAVCADLANGLVSALSPPPPRGAAGDGARWVWDAEVCDICGSIVQAAAASRRCASCLAGRTPAPDRPTAAWRGRIAALLARADGTVFVKSGAAPRCCGVDLELPRTARDVRGVSAAALVTNARLLDLAAAPMPALGWRRHLARGALWDAAKCDVESVVQALAACRIFSVADLADVALRGRESLDALFGPDGQALADRTMAMLKLLDSLLRAHHSKVNAARKREMFVQNLKAKAARQRTDFSRSFAADPPVSRPDTLASIKRLGGTSLILLRPETF
ncbi:hypothetical protein M885DRAFT_569191 [Pelagophyceae sp. CCMP2097]|nr:hypothetical protein M885DRAFT_569191 [Pelagophyceae sp. CCMP2097]